MLRFSEIYSKRGVHGHFHGKEPWCLMEELNKPVMAKLVGKLSYFLNNCYYFLLLFIISLFSRC
jgi:hypothetical protein